MEAVNNSLPTVRDAEIHYMGRTTGKMVEGTLQGDSPRNALGFYIVLLYLGRLR
jgi:hypothetical protein